MKLTAWEDITQFYAMDKTYFFITKNVKNVIIKLEKKMIAYIAVYHQIRLNWIKRSITAIEYW